MSLRRVYLLSHLPDLQPDLGEEPQFAGFDGPLAQARRRKRRARRAARKARKARELQREAAQYRQQARRYRQAPKRRQGGGPGRVPQGRGGGGGFAQPGRGGGFPGPSRQPSWPRGRGPQGPRGRSPEEASPEEVYDEGAEEAYYEEPVEEVYDEGGEAYYEEPAEEFYDEGGEEAYYEEPVAAGTSETWRNKITLGDNLQVRARRGFRAVAMPWKNGMYIVAEVPEEVAQMEGQRAAMGALPLVPMLMWKSLKSAFKKKEPAAPAAVPAPAPAPAPVGTVAVPVVSGAPPRSRRGGVPKSYGRLSWLEGEDPPWLGCDDCGGRCKGRRR